MASGMAPPTLDPTNLLSPMDKLFGKRIDDRIEEVRHAPIPEAGIQTGGYTPAYLHLSHIPLFPLYNDKQKKALETKHKQKTQMMSYVGPPLQPTMGQSIVMTGTSILSGGMNPMSIMKWKRRFEASAAVSTQRSMEHTAMIVFTRWTVPTSPANPEIWFVDVVEWRSNSENKGAGVYLKSSKRESFRTIRQVLKEQKAQKTWKKRLNWQHCEEVIWVREDGSEVVMEMAARIQRPCAPTEAHHALKDFDKNWLVPVVVTS